MTVGHRLPMGSASRRLAPLFALALLFALVPAGVAFAEHRENVTDLEAEEAIQAAIEWSEFTFDESTDVALGRDDIFADNLASSVIQGTSDAPLLLTDTNELHDDVLVELERLGATTIHILGGDRAISEEVEDELVAANYEVHRDAGATRIETAIDIARRHAGDATEGLLVRAYGTDGGDDSRAWADALAAGGWAAAEDMPVFLTQSDELNDNLRAYLEDSDITTLTIVGGTSAVSAAVEAELEAMGITVNRVSGSNRFATAVEIAEARGFDSAAEADEVILSEGQDDQAWAGGFAAAAYSARNNAPIVLSNEDNIPPETEEFLNDAAAENEAATQDHEGVHLVCGAMVDDGACEEAADIMGLDQLAPHGNETLTLGPDEASENTESTNAGDDENRGSRQYSVSGLDDDTEYDIQLFPCDNVTTTEDGQYSFDDAESNDRGNDEADLGTTNAVIEVINGAAQATPGRTAEVQPVNGTITFSVDNESPNECVVPVVFEDTEDDNTLELDANNEPTEAFGAGGQKTWIPEEAGQGDPAADEEVESVDADANRFITTDATYFYDANDTFFVRNSRAVAACTVTDQVTMAEFEEELSENDFLDLDSTYQPNEELSSRFCLEDVAPAAPGTPTADETDDTSTVLTVPGVDEDADAVTIYGNSDATADNVDTDDDVFATATEDADEDTAGYQVNVTGLEPETAYEFAATQTVGSEESAISDDVDVTTDEEGANAAFESVEATATDDNGLQGEVDADDVWQIAFSQPVNQPAAGDIMRVVDEDGESYDLVYGTDWTATRNASAETFEGAEYEAGEILTVTITDTPTLVDRDGAAGNNDGVVNYPATITTQSGITEDEDDNPATDDGTPWTPADDPDNVVELGGTASEDDIAAEMQSATASETTDQVVVTYDETVACVANGDVAQWDYTDDDDTDVNPTAYTCAGDEVTLTFAPGVIEAGDTPFTIEYTEGADAADRVEDANDNEATSPDSASGAIVA